MQRSTILFLCFSALLASCSATSPVQGLKPVKLEDNVYKVAYFSNPSIDYVYKANVWVYGNELSGILVFKRINDKTHRVVLTTEFGNTLFDFDVSAEDYKINAIVDEFNRRMMIDVLVNDFRLLLRPGFNIAQQFEADQAKILLSPDGSRSNLLYLTKTDDKLFQIKQATPKKEKVTLLFDAKNPTFAERISVEHHDIKLRIALQYLKNHK